MENIIQKKHHYQILFDKKSEDNIYYCLGCISSLNEINMTDSGLWLETIVTIPFKENSDFTFDLKFICQCNVKISFDLKCNCKILRKEYLFVNRCEEDDYDAVVEIIIIKMKLTKEELLKNIRQQLDMAIKRYHKNQENGEKHKEIK